MIDRRCGGWFPDSAANARCITLNAVATPAGEYGPA